jgi:hypothetical protein
MRWIKERMPHAVFAALGIKRLIDRTVFHGGGRRDCRPPPGGSRRCLVRARAILVSQELRWNGPFPGRGVSCQLFAVDFTYFVTIIGLELVAATTENMTSREGARSIGLANTGAAAHADAAAHFMPKAKFRPMWGLDLITPLLQ